MRKGFNLVIMDESHCIKNDKSARKGYLNFVLILTCVHVIKHCIIKSAKLLIIAGIFYSALILQTIFFKITPKNVCATLDLLMHMQNHLKTSFFLLNLKLTNQYRFETCFLTFIPYILKLYKLTHNKTGPKPRNLWWRKASTWSYSQEHLPSPDLLNCSARFLPFNLDFSGMHRSYTFFFKNSRLNPHLWRNT